MSDKISVVVPCYNEEEALPYFYEEITRIFRKMQEQWEIEYEVIFVNDGSKDGTLLQLRGFAKKNACMKYLSFSRNFGKESAILAGLTHTSGDYTAVMDADLQDPPELLESMYHILKTEEYDCVGTRRVTRKGEPPVRSFFAKLFYKLINKISKTEVSDGARDFRLMTRQMTDAILSMKEYNRFSKGIFGWVGFQTKWLSYENRERVAGDTKWSFWKLFAYSIDGITAFSTVPLSIAAVLGVLFLLVAFVFIVLIILKTILYGDPVAGYPSLMCVILFIGGIQLLTIGILGQYLSKTYLEAKNRPSYIVKEKGNMESGETDEKTIGKTVDQI